MSLVTVIRRDRDGEKVTVLGTGAPQVMDDRSPHRAADAEEAAGSNEAAAQEVAQQNGRAAERVRAR